MAMTARNIGDIDRGPGAGFRGRAVNRVTDLNRRIVGEAHARPRVPARPARLPSWLRLSWPRSGLITRRAGRPGARRFPATARTAPGRRRTACTSPTSGGREGLLFSSVVSGANIAGSWGCSGNVMGVGAGHRGGASSSGWVALIASCRVHRPASKTGSGGECAAGSGWAGRPLRGTASWRSARPPPGPAPGPARARAAPGQAQPCGGSARGAGTWGRRCGGGLPGGHRRRLRGRRLSERPRRAFRVAWGCRRCPAAGTAAPGWTGPSPPGQGLRVRSAAPDW